MKGYHYTSWENWQEIQRVGLRPYPIRNPNIRGQFPVGTKGIFTWIRKPEGMAHYGQVIWIMIHHHTLSVVLLSYEFEEWEEHGTEDAGRWVIRHDGKLCSSYGTPWVFHDGEPAVLLKHPILLSRVNLEAVYDLQGLVDSKDISGNIAPTHKGKCLSDKEWRESLDGVRR